MADMPDLSHLTAEERAIIENVMMRQRQEDEQQKEIMQRKQDEVNTLEDTIRQRSEQQRKAGIELEATCHICLKTKFADGVGHICHYCNIRCCARCGGKTTIRGKVIWVCMVCRKKQELLSSTGQWMKTTEGEGFICATGGSLHPDPHDPSDKRPKLERARSAAEKENLPLQRTGSGLRRQYSHDSSVDMLNPAQRRMQQQIQASNASQHFQQSSLYGTNHHQSTHQQPSSDIYSTDEDPKYYQGELDGLMLKHPHLMHPRQQRHFIKQQQHSHSSGIQLPQPMQSHYHRQEHLHPSQQHLQQHSSSGAATQNINQHKRPIAGHLAQQTSFSSSEEEYDAGHSTKLLPHDNNAVVSASARITSSQINDSKLDVHHRNNYNRTNHRLQHSPQIVVGDDVDFPHQSNDPYWNNDSRGLSDSTATLVGGNNVNTILTGRIGGHGGSLSAGTSLDEPNAYSIDSRRYTERRKKTVRFDGQDSNDWTRWDSERQNSQDSATRDSGIDSGSTFTSSEDSNRGEGLKQNPVHWQVSTDGTRMSGHLILRRNFNSEDTLGLLVFGGQLLSNGRLGAIIEKIKPGSIADQVGHLKPGDEIVEWNGQSFGDRSDHEVQDIIANSKHDLQVELIVSRVIAASRRAAQVSWRQSHSPIRLHAEAYDRRDRPSVLVTSPSSPDRIASGASGSGSRYSNRISSTGPIVGDSNVGPIGGPVIDNSNVGGRIQIKLGFESGTLQLILTVICAANLTYRANGATRNPYVKIFLLPDRCDKSKRRSKPLTNTNDPRWGETFVYSGLRRADLNNRYLEITVWDYVRYGANDFLGEVLLDLRSHPLDDEAEWYTLHVHQESNIHTLRRDDTNEMDMILTPTDHLSPPSTTSRLSDSDTTSECDIDGIATGRDGASISSLGSSSSPPAETDLNERRSRRDMSPQGKKRATAMVARDYRTVSGIGQSYHNNNQTIVTSLARRNGVMAMNQRSHSAAPSDNYRSANIIRRGSLSPPEDLYQDYSGLTVHNRVQQRSQSRSATATPTGSPKKRQLPQVPQNSMSAGSSTNRMVLRDRDRLMQDFEERGIGRFSRYRTRQPHHHSHHQQTYRSTGMGGWERCYTGLSDSDLTMHSLEPRLRPKNSLSPDKDFMGDFGDSDMESVVSVTSSAFSTQSERPRGSRGLSSEYDVRDRGSISAGTNNRGHQSLSSNNRESYRDRNEREPSRSLSDRDPREQDSFNRSLSTAEGTPDEKIDGSLSDTAVGMPGFDRSRRNPNQRSPKCETPTRDRDRFGTGMGKKSNSTSQLSATDQASAMSSSSQRKRSSSGSIQRSVEVTPSSSANRAGSLHSISTTSDYPSWSPSLRVADGGQYSDFVDGLGPGQLVGRQVLGAASLGDIQLSLCHQKGYLEVEVIRARGLQLRPGSKVVPAPCVKVYLLNGKKIIKKLKTVTARRTLDPLYQQQLVFREPFAGCLLQVIVWGDYSRMDKKVFMGAALIELDNINLSNIVIGWYRLFASSSMVSVITSSMSLSRRSSITSLESLKL
ncbi:regulating synaptic membrane exocytosis protein 2 isoform X2 [Contarinia nasturtii]|uniref:regulating synaptic membrane exocytosis protein 2 isoform X2 n=1 Tax=Contarinia nasturtii TaxID=265458 RepID=UPI0012D45D80|nr:regulating synaptic membrane exocytosis protein 2 isoform X2 [Contarinia nasturtii]